MKVSRRGFLAGAAAAGWSGGTEVAGAAQASQVSTIFDTPPTVERRNGMPYRAFGRTGDNVSILGIGGYHIGVPDEADGVRLIRTAIDSGVSFMDNAWEYHDGESERRMGRALRDGYREKTFLMTKGCARDAKGAMSQLEDSLRHLQTDVIDLWQFHECNYDNDPDLLFAVDGAIHAAVKAKEQGKIRFIGFTGHKSPHIHLKMLAQDFDWDALQMPLNLCDAHYRSFARQVLPVALERGIAVIAMKTQGGGAIPEKAPVTPLECLHYAMSPERAGLSLGHGGSRYRATERRFRQELRAARTGRAQRSRETRRAARRRGRPRTVQVDATLRFRLSPENSTGFSETQSWNHRRARPRPGDDRGPAGASERAGARSSHCRPGGGGGDLYRSRPCRKRQQRPCARDDGGRRFHRGCPFSDAGMRRWFSRGRTSRTDCGISSITGGSPVPKRERRFPVLCWVYDWIIAAVIVLWF